MSEKKVKKLSKGGIVEALSEALEISKKEAKGFLEAQAELAYSETKRCGEFVLFGIGKLVKKDRKARMGRNPATGEKIKIAAKTVLKFRVGKAARVAVLGDQATKKKKKKR